MTGYGAAERETTAGVVRVELRSVNHRYFRANLRLAPALESIEGSITERLRERLNRGHVNGSVRLDTPDAGEEGGAPLQLNEARARQYVKAFRTLKERLGVSGEVDIDLISRFGDVIEPAPTEPADLPAEEVVEVVDAAARELAGMRVEEGRRLAKDLESRLCAMEDSLDRINERAPERLEAERDRLRTAIGELAGDVRVDEGRLAQEIAYLAEKWDVGEEHSRLRAHIAAFRDFLAGDDDEPVGKRLSFLVQEMHRESNTIGAKANDAEIEHEVVQVKNEIERLREQVENVE